MKKEELNLSKLREVIWQSRDKRVMSGISLILEPKYFIMTSERYKEFEQIFRSLCRPFNPVFDGVLVMKGDKE